MLPRTLTVSCVIFLDGLLAWASWVIQSSVVTSNFLGIHAVRKHGSIGGERHWLCWTRKRSGAS